MKKIHYGFIAVAVLILFLLITNPTLKDFKEHIGITDTAGETKMYLQRRHNYFIFSNYAIVGEGGEYLAIAGNFFYLKNKKQVSLEYIKAIYDRLSPTIELGDFDSFKEQLKDKNFRMAIFKKVAPIMKLDDYNEYESQIKSATN